MPTATYEKIQSTTLSSATATITFSSIPATYTDLRLVLAGTNDSGSAQSVKLRFNGDTASNYSDIYFRGTGSSVVSSSDASRTFIDVNFAFGATIPTMTTLDMLSYAGATYKTVLITNLEDQNGSGRVELKVASWRSTSAITSIVFSLGTGNYNTGTIATLYGIKAA